MRSLIKLLKLDLSKGTLDYTEQGEVNIVETFYSTFDEY